MKFDFKNGCKIEFKDKKRNHEADPELGFLTKSISMSYGGKVSIPAWKLTNKLSSLTAFVIYVFKGCTAAFKTILISPRMCFWASISIQAIASCAHALRSLADDKIVL